MHVAVNASHVARLYGEGGGADGKCFYCEESRVEDALCLRGRVGGCWQIWCSETGPQNTTGHSLSKTSL